VLKSMLRQQFFDSLALLSELLHLLLKLSDGKERVTALLNFWFGLLGRLAFLVGTFRLELGLLLLCILFFYFLLLYFFWDDDSGFGLEEGFGKFTGCVFGDFGVFVMRMMLGLGHGFNKIKFKQSNKF
jgi:hypothetical protein